MLPDLFPNNRSIDSTDGINAWIDQREPLPAGAFFIKNPPFSIPRSIIGSGNADSVRADGAWSKFDNTVLIHDGPNLTTPLCKIYRPNLSLRSLTLQGKSMWKAESSIGVTRLVEMYQPSKLHPPVGDITFEDVTFLSAEEGLYTAPGSHCDHINLVRCISHKVNKPIVINENQSVDFDIDLLCKGDGKTIITAMDGGRMRGSIVINGRWERFLILGDGLGKTFPTKNNGYFNFHLMMDAGDKFGSLVEEKFAYEWSRPVVRINGFMADDSIIEEDPILLNKADVQIKMERCLQPDYIFNSP